MEITISRQADFEDITQKVLSAVAAKSPSLHIRVDVPDQPGDHGRSVKICDVAKPLREAANDQSRSSTQEECAIGWLASCWWLACLCRQQTSLTSEQIQSIGNWISRADSPSTLFPDGCDSATTFLLYAADCAGFSSSLEKLPADTLSPPLELAGACVRAYEALSAVKLGLAALMLSVEACQINPSILESFTFGCESNSATMASTAAWLIEESKIAPRAAPATDSEAEAWLSVIPALAELQTAATSLLKLVKAELRTSMKRVTEKQPKGAHFLPFTVASQSAERHVADAASTAWYAIESIFRNHLMACGRPLSVKQRYLADWPAGTLVPPEVEIPGSATPVSPALLDFVTNERAAAAKMFESKPIEALKTEAAACIATSVAILADAQAGAYNAAVMKAQKNSKNVSARIHFGKPLQTFVMQLVMRICPTAVSPRVFPPNTLQFAVALMAEVSGISTDISRLLDSILATGNQLQRRPKIAKGAIDVMPRQMIVREILFEHIKNVFLVHGAVGIDTPVFELRETLMGKYGEDSKLVYELADQGGERLALRYDLTVPFARYCASHNVDKMKRYHLAKVYRRDEPQLQKGRFREFYQCDFDIVGEANSFADAEVVMVLIDCLKPLTNAIGPFSVKLSHRKLLDALMAEAGVPSAAFRPVCSAIDKLDKCTWKEVRLEILSKGVQPDVADRIWTLLQTFTEDLNNSAEDLNNSAFSSPFDVLDKIEKLTPSLLQRCPDTLANIRSTLQLLDAAGMLDLVRLDLSLARGLDYYTGIIYEAVLTSATKVGSVAAGGRYDDLVGIFAGKQLPAVGVSIGIERILRIVEDNLAAASDGEDNGILRDNNLLEVYICSVGANLSTHKLKIANLLRSNGILTDYTFADNARLVKQMTVATSQRVPLCVIFGEEEVKKNTVKLREFQYGQQAEPGGVASSSSETDVSLDELVTAVKEKLSKVGRPLQLVRKAIFGAEA